MTIAVAPQAQGQGLGTVLLHWLIAEARRAGAQHLMLEVRADNMVAQRLYSAAGFALLTTRRRYYQPGDVDALILRMHLWDTAEDPIDDQTEPDETTAEDAPK
jgi:ribosomal-protein-alanine N-acetyltransferase